MPPPRQLLGGGIVIATHNPGKLQEFRSLFADTAIMITTSDDHDLAAPDETGDTFAANAAIKAHAAARKTGLPAIADDSGLTVDALDGQPGIATADWAETANGRDYPMAMRRVRNLLMSRSVPEPHRAQFRSTLCVAWPDGHEQFYAGLVAGRLTWPMRGALGFGFDPVFIPDGHTVTFGEMDRDRKNMISHRALALKTFAAECLGAP